MKKSILGVLLLACMSHLPVSAEEIYLEGISILGSKKTAHILYNGESLTLKPGDEVGEWVLDSLGDRSIFLRPADAKAGDAAKLTELSLHDRLEKASAAANPFQAALQNAPAASKEPPPIDKFKPRRIPDDQVPEGHRRIRTPFGDVLVKEEQK